MSRDSPVYETVKAMRNLNFRQRLSLEQYPEEHKILG
jgi:hypothetical protein